MSLQQIYELLGHPTTWVAVVVILMSIIQITPIKLNPWSWIAKKVGRAINKEVLDRIKDNDKKTDEAIKEIGLLKDEINRKNALEARMNILRFDDELYNGMKHSKEYFVQELNDIDIYEKYCNSHPDFKNSCAVEAIKHVRDTYQKCLTDHKFI